MNEDKTKKVNNDENQIKKAKSQVDLLDIDKQLQEEIIDNWDIFSSEENLNEIDEDLNDIKIENLKEDIQKSKKTDQWEEIKRKFEEKMKALTWNVNHENKNNNINLDTNKLEKEIEEVENMMPNIYKWRPGFINKNETKIITENKINDNDNIDDKKIEDEKKIEEIREKVTMWNTEVVTKRIEEKRKEKEKFNKLRVNYWPKMTSNESHKNENIQNKQKFEKKIITEKNIETLESKKDISEKAQKINPEIKNIENPKIDEKKIEILESNINSAEKIDYNTKKVEEAIEKKKTSNNNDIIDLSWSNEKINKNEKIGKIISLLYVSMFLWILIFAWVIYYNYFPIEKENWTVNTTNIEENTDKKETKEIDVDYSKYEQVSYEWVIVDRYSDRYDSSNDKKFKYLNTMNYWTIKIKNKDNSRIDCRWAIVVNGNIIESWIKDNETLNSSKILMVDDYECIWWLNPSKRYEFNIQHWYIQGYLINPFEETTKFKIWIDEISEKEYEIAPKEKVEFNFKLNCNDIFLANNNIEYYFRIYLTGEKSLYNRKIPFTLTKDKCSAIEIEKLTIDQYWTYKWNTLKIPIWKPITIKALINNIWWLNLFNTALELDIPSSSFDNLWEKKQYISHNWSPSNRITEIIDTLEINEKKEINITFTPILSGTYRLNGRLKSENIMWLDIEFSYEIIAYQNWIEFTEQLISTKSENNKGSSIINLDLMNDNFPSDYKIYIYWPDLESSDFDWYKLQEKWMKIQQNKINEKRKWEQIYYKKLISNDYYEQLLGTEETLKVQIIMYEKTKKAYIDIIPIWDISKKKTIKIN